MSITGLRTTFRRLECLLSKCWSRYFSDRKLFLQYPQRHSFMSTWILCCSWSLKRSLSGWSLQCWEIGYFSCSTNGIKYCTVHVEVIFIHPNQYETLLISVTSISHRVYSKYLLNDFPSSPASFSGTMNFMGMLFIVFMSPGR